MNNRALAAWANHDKICFWDALSQQIAAIEQPYAKFVEINKRIEQSLVRTPWVRARNPGTSYFLPAVGNCREALERFKALARCLRVVNAWQRAHGAKRTLDQLGLPVEATIDPYIGNLLKLVETPNGLLIYSVGRDLIDDGGSIGAPGYKDVGFGPVPSMATQLKQ
jgi:hypothetical protein